ncbi:glucosaminidase domain and LysM peptidoglycan-binding domain-containing protein [Pedobacter mucosus]|uniref:glucosaminidase domain and LysM peptidoglycan-binding domain-containing protein n=1 Tax=Pedobacter mucosus TaxID=2895286 RepID=UPI001EE3D187|nr:glucosaminidase domain-containing protein [Pedobacter mucosus]UKT63419.1 glucosaminidase domain-containing protein [Pedobacter mucosus]
MKKLLIFCALFLSLSTTKAKDTEGYIAQHVEFAQCLMRDYKIPASLILAVAIHESASGNSRIAQYLNNHFGVKGANTNLEIQSSYRDYLNADESYSHFVEIMETRVPFNALFAKYDQYDYQGWAKGIQRSGYAQSRTWSSQVIALIKKYELYQYDDRPEGYEEPVYKTTYRRKSKSSLRYYTVKTGDNLSILAKKKGTTVLKLMKRNGLKKANLKIGQKIKL